MAMSANVTGGKSYRCQFEIDRYEVFLINGGFMGGKHIHTLAVVFG